MASQLNFLQNLLHPTVVPSSFPNIEPVVTLLGSPESRRALKVPSRHHVEVRVVARRRHHQTFCHCQWRQGDLHKYFHTGTPGSDYPGCQRVVHQAVLTGCEAPLRPTRPGKYPLLRSYFSLAGLSPGSFHLKHYSGMLQGIFEPAAERKGVR